MVGPTAQLVALCCHFNGRARGIASGAFFPVNSTSQFCEYVHFVRERGRALRRILSRSVLVETPDEWLAHEARPGRSAVIVHHTADSSGISDRMSAGFVGGGGRWLLAVTGDGQKDFWEASWEVGKREAADQRIWRVRYGLVKPNAEFARPQLRTVETLVRELRQALIDIHAFAEEHQMEGFAGCFIKAIQCLSADDPFSAVFHKDLAPNGLLDLPAGQLLAACQTAWVFGGMGSWNDMGFQGSEQKRYERLSDALFVLLNEGICAGANSGAESR